MYSRWRSCSETTICKPLLRLQMVVVEQLCHLLYTSRSSNHCPPVSFPDNGLTTFSTTASFRLTCFKAPFVSKIQLLPRRPPKRNRSIDFTATNTCKEERRGRASPHFGCQFSSVPIRLRGGTNPEESRFTILVLRESCH